MRPILLLLLGLTGCDQVFSLDRPDRGVLLDGFDARKPIRISSVATSALTDFPVALVLEDDADLVAGVRGGRDFAVTTTDGERLDIELERFDAATGDLLLWVRIPTLAPDAETAVYLYFGGDPQVVDAPRTWAAGYAAVWHLDGDAVSEGDSTRNTLELRASSILPATDDGIAGAARTFDGTADQLVGVDADVLDAGTASFSISLWVFAAGATSGFDMPLNKGGASIPERGYDYELGSGVWQAQISDGDELIILPIGTDVLAGSWRHLATVVDREQDLVFAYLDGELITKDDLIDFGSMSNARALTVGGYDPFDGRIDEVRLYHGALSDDWIATEHRNLRTPESFLLVGAAESLR